MKAAKDLAAGNEPAEPWKPEIYHMHRETAGAPTAEEAVARARDLAMTDLLAARQEVATQPIRV